MSDPIHDARLEVINEISNALCKAAGDALTRHGNDPQNVPILLAGFDTAVNRIDRGVAPGFRFALGATLTERK